MAYINLAGGLKINTADAVDSRLVLSKNEMLTMHYDDTRPAVLAGKIFQLPDHYLCVCSDDGKVYLYDSTNEESEETGKFTLFDPQGVTLVKVTYSELVALRNNSELIPGVYYLITDYVTTTTSVNTRSAGNLFNVIVRADDENHLNENCSFAHSDRDINGYFAESKLEAWQGKYCLDNDNTRFAWADTENGKGVIYWLKDEYGNEAPYDFKNIQFKRFYDDTSKIYELTNDYGYFDESTLLENIFSYNSLEDVDGEDDYIWCYTFNSNETIDVFSKESSRDITLLNKVMYNAEYNEQPIHNNVIKPYYISQIIDDSESYKLQCLNNIVFSAWYETGSAISVYSNKFGENCHDNTFIGKTVYSNTFGNNCYSNTFGNNFNYNTFGNGCYSNTFGNDCGSNTFGNQVQQTITAINNCRYIIIENGCHYLNITTQDAESVGSLQNIHICLGIIGTYDNRKTITETRNNSFDTTYRAAGSQDKTI